jgi:hypothetical protein
MNAMPLNRLAITLQPESSRVIIRPFIPDSSQRIASIIGRALALTEDEATRELNDMHQEFDARHLDIETTCLSNTRKCRATFSRIVPYPERAKC